ncbi:hypothetical protein RR48_14501 [Papilio machaon]|uniref:DUF4817 domain-containing protein n=1 Tax=Papilio machaon TaxID=76193 RepID=A0A194QKY9_PAPMA|nr:hypothetical protein RR48_14501 [Papilio machaon]
MHLIYEECRCNANAASRLYRERYPNDQKYPDYRVFINSITPSVSMLMSDALSINIPIENIENSPLRSPTSVETSRTRVERLDNLSSEEGGSFWSTQGTMKIIDFTKTQELLVPPPSDPFETFQC